MVRLVALVVCLLCCLGAASGTEMRGAASLVEPTVGLKPFSSSRALVIGIDHYDNGWEPLHGAIDDAEAVAAALKASGFDKVDVQIDPDSIALERAIKNFVYVTGADPDARLLIWFAGHGHTINGEGYIVPRDAPRPGPTPAEEAAFQAVALPLAEFGRYMNEVKARHVLAVFDSCFSGTVFSANRVSVTASVEKSSSQVARQFIASGSAGEEVFDQGAFRRAFLDALAGLAPDALTSDGYLTGSGLGGYLAKRISKESGGRQNPIYSTSNVVGYDRGDFLFPQSYLAVGDGQSGTIVTTAVETAPTSPSMPVPELRIEPVDPSAGDAEATALADQLARSLIEYYVVNKLYVSSALTEREPSRAPTHWLKVKIRADGDRAVITTALAGGDGHTIATAEFSGRRDFLQRQNRLLPQTIQYLLDVSLRTMEPLHSASRPTLDGEAYTYFLAARTQAARGKYADAEALMKEAVAIDGSFASGFAAIADLAERLGEPAETIADYRAKAVAIDPDFQPLNVFGDQQMGDPVPALREAGLVSSWSAAGQGLEFRRIDSPDYGISVLAWRLDQQHAVLKIAKSMTSHGESAAEFRDRLNGLLAVNGGFFDMDVKNRLSPVGLLVIDGHEISSFDSAKASNPLTGVLFTRDGRVGIIPAREFSSAEGYESAVQTGPMVVDPGGKNGIWRNAFDRQNRTALCLEPDGEAQVVAVWGGLSLFELGELLSTTESAGGFGCERAVNLDGGPSSQASMAAGGVALELPGLWKVSNSLIVVPKQ